MSSLALAEPSQAASVSSLVERLGLEPEFAESEVLELALRHRSWCGEQGGVASNERLEFLGDAVLQMMVTDRLYRIEPDSAEGALAQRRASLVSTRALAGAARRIDLGSCIRLGRGEQATGGADKDSILADCAEALFGAYYLYAGIESATALIGRFLDEEFEQIRLGNWVGDPKSRLQEVAVQVLELVPQYEIEEVGPDHAKEFTAEVHLGDNPHGRGIGRTKKEAEQAAAQAALERLANEGKLEQ